MRVTVVGKRGQAVLVEFQQGGLRRVYVPRDAVMDEEVDDGALEAGIPYGVPWEEFVQVVGVTPDDLADALRRRGIWTAEDLQKRHDAALGALMALTGLTLAALRKAASQYRNMEVGNEQTIDGG